MTTQNILPAGVLVFGCSDELVNSGLKADERAVAAQEVSVITVTVGSAIRNEESHVEIIAAEPSLLINKIDDAFCKIECKAAKIGALFTEESVRIVSRSLRQNTQLLSIMDVEPFFKTGPPPKQELITVLRKEIFPSLKILSATVPEVKALLDEAGIPVDYPKSIQDVQSMANTLRSLGPEYVIIKREVFEESDGMTTLHFVLCGNGEPLTVTSRCENPKRLFGASYSIPPAIAAHLAKGYSVPEAVSASFKFAEEMLKGGQYFN
ncbi:pyridoxamine kinase [Trichoderma chlorosporum]